MDDLLREVLDESNAPEFVGLEQENSILRELTEERSAKDLGDENPRQLVKYGLIYEGSIVCSWREAKLDQIDEAAAMAFNCWRSLANLGVANGSSIASRGALFLAAELDSDLVSKEESLAFRIAVTATLSGFLAESRLLLRRFNLSDPPATASWRDRVIHDIALAFILLTRKSSGWSDVFAAQNSIDRLRKAQKGFESDYLKSVSAELQREAALELVGLYHLAQILTLTAAYLIKGSGGISKLKTQLERHFDKAFASFEAGGSGQLIAFAVLLMLGCERHARNSIWTHVAAIAPLQRFAETVTNENVANPLIELWPAQQEALQSSFLDPYKTAISVQMPTSAGKTLLAKFAILQSIALAPTGQCIYIVPTRALVNQVTFELRRDFRPLNYRVEQTVPATEMDPTENVLLSDPPNVLVTTPEKLDLLVRDNHPCTRDIVLVIADEAHNLQDEHRGERLELVLGIIKRDCPNVRFLLLSPFIPNADELVAWLGDARKLAPIQVEWRPSRRVVGLLKNSGRTSNRKLFFETLAAAGSVDVSPGRFVVVDEPTSKNTIESISCATVNSFAKRGTVLVLCRGKATANDRAEEIAKSRKPRKLEGLIATACAYVETEVGGPSLLSTCLKRGVAFHHAGLSHETRWLLERLVCDRAVDVVCGTTTLAQGVNFPISSVIVETLKKGDADLSFSDFWNIAGRAGRALMDSVGVIGFPAPSKAHRTKCETFLRREADEIVSQLMSIIDSADQLVDKMNLHSLRTNTHLSSFLRFLSHAARVAGKHGIGDDVEDVLRASLLYNQAQKRGTKGTSSLIRLCRRYFNELKDTNIRVLNLADRTGFATPTVNFLLSTIRNEHTDLKRPETWSPDVLFGEDPGPLTERIKVMSEVPEMSLGQGDDTPFSAELVACILRDWVNGESLQKMADQYWKRDNANTAEKRLTGFSNYLFSKLVSQTSWGLGALHGCSVDPDKIVADSPTEFVPSMAFFGVAHKEAVWLRMAGAPRIVAEQLGELWRKTKTDQPRSYQELRDWISGRTLKQWEAVIPTTSKLSAEDMQKLWNVFSGEPTSRPKPSR